MDLAPGGVINSYGKYDTRIDGIVNLIQERNMDGS
jgi:hypothetical protein